MSTSGSPVNTRWPAVTGAATNRPRTVSAQSTSTKIVWLLLIDGTNIGPRTPGAHQDQCSNHEFLPAVKGDSPTSRATI
jgi:hypothetical protein